MVVSVIIAVSNRETIYVDIDKVGEWTTHSSSSSSDDDELRVNFFFTYFTRTRERYDLPIIETPRLTKYIVGVNTAEGFDPEAVLERELGGWDFSNDTCEMLIEVLLYKTQDMLNSVSRGCNVLGVSAKVLLIQMPSGSSRTDEVVQRSLEERNFGTVPATSSSIQLLERKILTASDIIDGTTNCESCRICLEEFSVGCQVKCMPCSHTFHGDCIVQWLMINHYCPLCRFEMPKC